VYETLKILLPILLSVQYTISHAVLYTTDCTIKQVVRYYESLPERDVKSSNGLFQGTTLAIMHQAGKNGKNLQLD
jgi:hypothetical protein